MVYQKGAGFYLLGVLHQPDLLNPLRSGYSLH
jgi:hypothetical protein